MIAKGEIYSGYESQPFDFNQKVFLLDSGAYNIIKVIAEQVNYDINKFNEVILEHIIAYYDFANKLNFDIVVSFDMGGKYTEKDGEKQNRTLISFLSKINADELNNKMLETTAKYLSENKNYHPKMLATIHGATPEDYRDNVRFVLETEQKYNIKFWGFALGGIASYKQVDSCWYDDINLRSIGKRGFIETITPARACKIVRELVGDRPIHALGCGGYNNITLNYYCGATSFDAASPVRRVGDGNLASTKIVFNPTPSKESFSKYFMGGFNSDNTIRDGFPRYIKLNEVPNDMSLCGCASCQISKSVFNIKTLYAMKAHDSEANYFSRQLIGLHAVLQHRKLCEIISDYKTMDDFSNAYENPLIDGLAFIYRNL